MDARHAYSSAGIYNVTVNVTDLDHDGDVDRDNLNILLGYRNQPASACLECDLNQDGTINVLDTRQLVLLCTRTYYAIE